MKAHRRVRTAYLWGGICLTALLTALGCSKDGEQGPKAIPVETVQVTAPQTGPSVEAGLKLQLSAVVLPQGAAQDLQWTSSDPTVATVDQNGTVSALQKGSATITAAAADAPETSGSIGIQVTRDHFVTTWNAPQITVPTDPQLSYHYSVDWDNDGTFDQHGITGDASHSFPDSGPHTIRITGQFAAIRFGKFNDGESTKITSLDQWGTIQWESFYAAFTFCTNLKIPATDVPDLSRVADMEEMFGGAAAADPDVSNWDTSSVTDMAFMFASATNADPDVSNWDTSSVTDMRYMFAGATSADPIVDGWQLSNIDTKEDMDGLFDGSGLSTEHYEAALVHFADQAESLPKGMLLGAVPAAACSQEAIAARQILLDNGWTINDKQCSQ